ncbi:hypothetical protein BT67DRAFT_370272 [Trichocladium antarcticum]|uniref:dolichol kinase n=1 Tax=Trichocladium antarcticum TaxID=1450529 RepID=A0AAN6UTV4_9PEZI|nr:hypothetical protein BT67DRAFT_370272 [Trichocladium antarcticum]
MPEHLQPPPTLAAADSTEDDDDHDTIRRVPSRSPHPYRRHNSELLDPSNQFAIHAIHAIADPFPSFAKDSPGASESGTEADDEHFLKGLPAPRGRPHKGLRGKNEALSGASTPHLSPAVPEEEGRQAQLRHEKRRAAESSRRRREIVRRAVEVLLLVCQGAMVGANADVQPFLRLYQKELRASGVVMGSLLAAYPLRLVLWACRQGTPSKPIPIRVPSTFDPAPLLYPTIVPALLSLLVAQNVRGAVLPSLVLGISALPRPLIPGAHHWEYISSSHWLLSCIPFTLHRITSTTQPLGPGDMPREVLVLLYPLHQTLCLVLHHLTTTSLLISELHLLSAGLISLFLLASSPQAVILKALLWGGGLGLTVLCGHAIQSGIALARVPKWRFRRGPPPSKSIFSLGLLGQLLSPRQSRPSLRSYQYNLYSDSDRSTDECPDGQAQSTSSPAEVIQADSISDNELAPADLVGPVRRHTLPSTGKPASRSKTNTPSGRRKRAASSSVRAFFSLTHTQATIRKWRYAAHVYASILAVILLGIRPYIQHHALSSAEPIGWALGYLLGNLPAFRLHVVKSNLERWICLPARPSDPAHCTHPNTGWADRARLTAVGGAATTRLVLAAYWLLVLGAGLAVVLRLSPVCEVDTRRKVFHFTMVAMLLPTAYVDPAYVALALAVALAVFLLLDLLRASQLPPLSRPIARFLAPYVDGRDLRGPVVISHIFLLIGCAIPLWLSLASLGRVRAGPDDGVLGPAAAGWEVAGREVAMVAGVVCVGLGDAAASLVGRRWGRRKWLWGGGKSIEGSVAFAVAVLGGLLAAALWLRVGGWQVASAGAGRGGAAGGGGGNGSGMDSVMSVLDWKRLWPWLRMEVPKAAACASLASLTEAVLTGGNDNVVVPVVLWGCVKSLGV